MKTTQSIAWNRYMNDNYTSFDKDKVGKWMYFFEKKDLEKVSDICKLAIVNNIVQLCKHSNHHGCTCSPYGNGESGVACFYLHFDDIDTHKKVIDFFIENDLIRKTKRGNFYNISFKLDNQTRSNQYGNSFSSSIKLSNFINLESGTWIHNKNTQY